MLRTNQLPPALGDEGPPKWLIFGVKFTCLRCFAFLKQLASFGSRIFPLASTGVGQGRIFGVLKSLCPS